MNIELLYGRGSLEITPPADADVTIIRKPSMSILADQRAAVIDALEKPVGSPSLREIANGATTACIAICDITRPVPNHLFLRPIIETLIDAGIDARDITVLVATGLHRPNEGDELAELIGDDWVLRTVNVANHFARNDGDHVDLGRTKTRGTVVRLDRRFVEADVRIATGLVEPHFMAGWSGGRKVIAPGLAHAETITTFHSARFTGDSNATNCNFLDNPLHEEQLEIIDMLCGMPARDRGTPARDHGAPSKHRALLSLNTVIDEQRRLSFVNFGEILNSHANAVDFARRYCEASVPRRFHTLVTSAAGYPLDRTYYQTVKAMVGPLDILSPGGDLFIISDCSEGIGSSEFAASQRRLIESGSDAFVESIFRKSHADIDEWQTQMQLRPMSAGNIHLYSEGLLSADRHLTGVNMVDPCIESLNEAIAASLQRGPDAAIAIIPEGPYVVPFHRPNAVAAIGE